jgi:methionyl-tRNA formyltransferase
VQIAVAATPEVAIPTLELLLNTGKNLVAVITQPDRPAGRGLTLKETPVALWAKEREIPVYKPNSQDELSEIVKSFDLVITIGFGMIIREEILAMPKFGFINLHFSILPRWRGAAPVQRAIEAGDAITGVTVFQLDRGMDTGPIYRQVTVDLEKGATSESLLSELAELGAQPVIETINAITAGEQPRIQESGGATRANKLSKEEGRIDWSLPVDVVDRKIRAFYPNPGSWTTFRGTIVKIENVAIHTGQPGTPGTLSAINRELVVSCGEGSLKVTELQPSGKPVMAASAWLNGAQLKDNERFE